MFARYIAGRPADHGQTIEGVSVGRTPGQTAQRIALRIDQLVADPKVAAGVLLFPEISTIDALARTFVSLQVYPHWNVTTMPLPRSAIDGMVAVRVVRDIPFGDEVRPSEGLVFGPFPEFPPTRRAPMVALEIFVGLPRATDPKTDQPTAKANLAHMKLDLPTQAAFDRMWNKSVEGRLASLGGAEDSRAKAKVSFVMPKDLADQLGCGQ
jgi:hypothetical protein